MWTNGVGMPAHMAVGTTPLDVLALVTRSLGFTDLEWLHATQVWLTSPDRHQMFVMVAIAAGVLMHTGSCNRGALKHGDGTYVAWLLFLLSASALGTRTALATVGRAFLGVAVLVLLSSLLMGLMMWRVLTANNIHVENQDPDEEDQEGVDEEGNIPIPLPAVSRLFTNFAAAVSAPLLTLIAPARWIVSSYAPGNKPEELIWASREMQEPRRRNARNQYCSGELVGTTTGGRPSLPAGTEHEQDQQ